MLSALATKPKAETAPVVFLLGRTIDILIKEAGGRAPLVAKIEKAEAIDHLDVEKAAPLEVAHALVALFQRAVVEVDDACEQGLIARVGLELAGERAHRAPCRQDLLLAPAALSLFGG